MQQLFFQFIHGTAVYNQIIDIERTKWLITLRQLNTDHIAISYEVFTDPYDPIRYTGHLIRGLVDFTKTGQLKN